MIDNMGAMLLIAAIIFAVLILLVLLRLAQKRSACAKKAFDVIKKKLFWNTFLRYVLQSTLKLQIAACKVILFDKMTTQIVTKETPVMSIISSYIILMVLNICPVLFYAVLYRNKSNLDKDLIKEKIGTLYIGMRAKVISVTSYSFIFLARRSLFIMITFNLYT